MIDARHELVKLAALTNLTRFPSGGLLNHHRCQNRAVHDGDGDLELGRLEQKYDQSLILFFGATPGPASKS